MQCKTAFVAAVLASSLSLASSTGAVPPGIDLTAGPPAAKDHPLEGPSPCRGGRAGRYACQAIDLASVLPLDELGGGRGNDLWGWTDPRNGREYVLMGMSDGITFVYAGDAENPLVVGRLPTQTTNSGWRDVKVYADHAFVVSEAAGHGLQVVNLRRLRPEPSTAALPVAAHYGRFGNAHNVAINEETGFAYVVGATSGEITCGGGGLHMIDVREPRNPRFAGCFSADGYTHDVQCVIYRGPDAAYNGREVCFAANTDTLTIVDVSDKANPRMISRTGYEGVGFTHQGWLSEDHVLFFMNDETDERDHGHNTRTYVWNVSDLAAPRLTQRYDHDTDAIDHNLYVAGRYVFEANYSAGLQVLEIRNPRAGGLRRVAYFDVFPGDDQRAASGKHHPEEEGDPLFGGAWSVYPYFASGVVAVSTVESGLFLLRPTFAFGGGGGGGGGCSVAPGSGSFCSECGPCGEGEGDCDGDGECAAGLVCADDRGADFGFGPKIDVCLPSAGGGGGGGGGGGCNALPGSGSFCTACGPCGAGEGDCDRDEECQQGLACVSDVGADFGFGPKIDVCLPPGGGTCPLPPGHGRFCSECGPCDEGEGDCDRDAECEGDLICAPDVGADFGFGPKIDVCVDPG
ncbi:MAG: choice-of-anchor B family protein [Acidobacteria bacterium]|nr:MAG: choice-of-anchor B family protein [Acidobacteriota bacterium]